MISVIIYDNMKYVPLKTIGEIGWWGKSGEAAMSLSRGKGTTRQSMSMFSKMGRGFANLILKTIE